MQSFDKAKITIIGTGNVGSSLGKKWLAHGHTVVYGVRNPSDSKHDMLRNTKASIIDILEAIKSTNIIVLAVPFTAVEEVINLGKEYWHDKIIIDCTNPLTGVPTGFGSGAEAIAAWTDSKRVVKAFNSTGSANILDTTYNDAKIDTFICGTDHQAKQTVKELAADAGFGVVDVGDLSQAHLLEAFAKLWINLAYSQNMGTNIAFKLLTK